MKIALISPAPGELTQLPASPENGWLAAGVHPDVDNYRGSPTPQLDQYDACVALALCGQPNFELFVKQYRKQSLKPPLIFLHDSFPAHDLLYGAGYPDVAKMYKLFRKCDGGLTPSRHCVDFFKHAMGIRSAFIPYHLPHDYVPQEAKDTKKNPNLCVVHTLARGRGNEPVMLLLQKARPEIRFMVHAPKEEGKRLTTLYKQSFGLSRISVWDPVDQQSFLKNASEAHMAISMDEWGSFGRFPLDMAALGIPCITSRKSTCGSMLWPELCTDPFFEVPQTLGLISTLQDPFIREQHVHRARMNLLALQTDRNVLEESVRSLM